jgi:hypothetical protein
MTFSLIVTFASAGGECLHTTGLFFGRLFPMNLRVPYRSLCEEEEEHNPSHRKICKEIELHTVILDKSNNWGIRTIKDPMVGYQKCKLIQKVQTLSSVIKENKNIQQRNTR